jgi:hypothetical protein
VSKRIQKDHFKNVQHLFDIFILQMRNINKDIDKVIISALTELEEANKRLNDMEK